MCRWRGCSTKGPCVPRLILLFFDFNKVKMCRVSRKRSLWISAMVSIVWELTWKRVVGKSSCGDRDCRLEKDTKETKQKKKTWGKGEKMVRTRLECTLEHSISNQTQMTVETCERHCLTQTVTQRHQRQTSSPFFVCPLECRRRSERRSCSVCKTPADKRSSDPHSVINSQMQNSSFLCCGFFATSLWEFWTSAAACATLSSSSNNKAVEPLKPPCDPSSRGLHIRSWPSVSTLVYERM